MGLFLPHILPPILPHRIGVGVRPLLHRSASRSAARLRTPLAAALTLLVLAGMPAPALAAGEYVIIDLGTLGGDISAAFDINKYGQIVGDSRLGPSGSDVRAFAVSPERGVWFRDDNLDGINDLMVDLSGTGVRSRANALNDFGVVVGRFRQDGADPSRPVVWDNGTQIAIAPLGSSVDDFGEAFDINNFGIVVGTSSDFAGGFLAKAFVWDGATAALPFLPNPSGGSRAFGINDREQIVGTSHAQVPGSPGINKKLTSAFIEQPGQKAGGGLEAVRSVRVRGRYSNPLATSSVEVIRR